MSGPNKDSKRDVQKKIYVKVTSDFDSTGYMQPRSITWNDGRTFPIEKVRDFRPASTLGWKSCSADYCFTVIIHGEERLLFFEKSDSSFASRLGRWFVLAAS